MKRSYDAFKAELDNSKLLCHWGNNLLEFCSEPNFDLPALTYDERKLKPVDKDNCYLTWANEYK